MPWSPLGAGFLTGKVASTATFDQTDFRAHSPRFTLEALSANQAVVDVVQQIATAKGATAAQVALAWLLAQDAAIVPIFGTRRLERVQENLGAADLVLSPDDLTQIQSQLAQIQVAGERLPPAILQLSYR